MNPLFTTPGMPKLNIAGNAGATGITPNQTSQAMSTALTSSNMPLGLKPKSPATNIKPQPTNLPPNQIDKSQTISTGTGSNMGTTGNMGNMGGVDNTAAIQSQLQSAQTQLGGLQNQLKQAQSLGYQPNQQINMGAGGQVLPPNTSQAGLISQLGGIAGNQSPQYQQAQQQYLDASQKLAALRASEAQQEANIGASGTNLAEAGGEQGLLQSLFAAKQAALTGEMTAAQTSAQAATGQQQTQQQGLGSAAGLLAPTLGSYGQAQYSPLGGLVGGGTGAGVSPSDPFYQTMQTYAQQLASGQSASIPSSVSGNPVLQAQLIQMAQQINPKFNYNAALGVGAAQQSNVQTAGTAGVTANQQVFNQAYSTYTQLQNTVQNVDQFGSLLTSGMTSADGTTINPTDAKFANQTLSAIRGQLSVPEQATYDTTLAALRGKISGLLSVGGNEIPTQVTADANKILDGSLPLGSLSSVLQRIQAEGNILLRNQSQIVNNAYQGIQTGGGASNSTNGTTNTTNGPTPPGLF